MDNDNNDNILNDQWISVDQHRSIVFTVPKSIDLLLFTKVLLFIKKAKTKLASYLPR